jgi:opacity protein-like surface antigen
MRMKPALLLLVVAFACGPAMAQRDHSEFAGAFAAYFNSNASGQGITDGPTNSGGFLINYRYHFNDWAALEVNYSRTRYTQYYSGAGGFITSWTQATAQEATMAFVVHFWPQLNGRLRPFGEAGTGALFWSPISSGSIGGPFNQSRPVLVYGGGIDWKWFSRFSIRAGYRGLVFTAPDFNVDGQFTNARTQIKQPYVGLTFRF